MSKKAFITAVFLLTSFLCGAQSLQEQIAKIKSDNSISDSLKFEKLYVMLDNSTDLKEQIFICLEHTYFASELARSNDPKKSRTGLINLGYAYYLMAKIYEQKSDYPRAISYYLQAIPIFEKINFLQGISDHLNNSALLYSKTGQLEKALDYFKKSLEIDLKRNDKNSVAIIYINIANTLYNLKDIESALVYIKKALALGEELESDRILFMAYGNLGSYYRAMKKTDSSLYYSFRAMNIPEARNKGEISPVYSNIGDCFVQKNQIDSAEKYIRLAIYISEYRKYYLYYGIALKKLAQLHILKKDYKSAEKAALQAQEILRKNNQYEELFSNSKILIDIYAALNNPSKTKEYMEFYSIVKDSLDAVRNRKSTIQKQMEIDFLLKENKLNTEREKKELLLKKEKEKQVLIRNIFIGGFILVLLFALYVYKNYRDKLKAGKIIETQKNELAAKHHELEEKQKEILDSIIYAKRLQDAILIPEKEVSNMFAEAFILYLPKDIVSGDFYWVAETEGFKLLAVADCTGHGVPGGFMSMLGYEVLQDILLKESIDKTSEALHAADAKMTYALNKSANNTRDGMDIALCAYNKTSRLMQFSGANRPLLQIRNGNLLEIKPDKLNIGGGIDGLSKQFSQHDIYCETGDLYYLFSDGYADQFGGTENKKFSTKKLKELLLSVHHLPLKEQKEKLHETFIKWKGNNDQLDDICIIGIKI